MRPVNRDHPRARLTALLRAGLLGLAVLVLLPLPVAAADGDPTPEPTPTVEPTPEPTPTPLPVRTVFNYRSNTVVRQFDGSWCVAAATQTMWNLVKGISNTTYSRQKSLYRQIRQHNRYRYRTLGNDIQGWAWALRTYTGEPYQARSFAKKNDAIRAIVEAIDRTGHPVGITVSHGRHAWIVLGYKSRPVAEGSDDQHDPGLLRERAAGGQFVGPVEVRVPVDDRLPQEVRLLPRVAAQGHLGRPLRHGERLTSVAPARMAAHVRRDHGRRRGDEALPAQSTGMPQALPAVDG